jgi:hypothetical protein
MHCSNCQAALPITRKPTSWGQFLLGGWTCPNCQAELNYQGRVLAKGYNTPVAVVFSLLFIGGIVLSNYLVFWAGRTGLSILTLIITLVLGNLGARALQPKVRAN